MLARPRRACGRYAWLRESLGHPKKGKRPLEGPRGRTNFVLISEKNSCGQNLSNKFCPHFKKNRADIICARIRRILYEFCTKNVLISRH